MSERTLQSIYNGKIKGVESELALYHDHAGFSVDLQGGDQVETIRCVSLQEAINLIYDFQSRLDAI